MFLHNLLNILAQIAKKIGLQKKFCAVLVADYWQRHSWLVGKRPEQA
jgi:hypothetical protein